MNGGKKPYKTIKYTLPISCQSQPAGAQVYVDGKLVCPSTPGIAHIDFQGEIFPDKKNMAYAYDDAKRRSSVTLTFVKDGYVEQKVVLEPTITKVKKNYYFDWGKSAYAALQRDSNSAYAHDTTIREGEAQKVVNRDAPGQTALERTIIRWYFDSEPRGARLFWRVISSIPDQVKNTNETYLMSTPYEETRSFNILGLTYENSRDVQIEVKCVKNGYYEQVKRFNVRQAIDQQEISSFFDLVAKEE